MNKSQLKQLIKEVIQEMKDDWYNIEGEEELNGKLYMYYAEVTHTTGIDDIEVWDIEIYDMDDPANANDSVKTVDDPKIIKYFKNAAIDQYIENKGEDGVWDDDGKDPDAESDYRAELSRDDY